MTDLTGHSLGRYQLLEKLGEGGMATVYKAFDTHLEVDVAVKVILTESLQKNVVDHVLKRFKREAKSLAMLAHPNIVKVTDYGEYEGKPYLVMQYLPGGTLKKRLGKPIPWQDAVDMILPIAEALEYAHSQHMVHRDVKPSNILLSQTGRPMLADFGIIKLLNLEETMDLTGTGMMIGTPGYMAPEQANSSTVDHCADIYSLGIVLYEMVTGSKPFVADTPMGVLIKQANEPIPRPSQVLSNLPYSVEKILLKSLAKKPENRYQNMGELIREFRDLKTTRGLPTNTSVISRNIKKTTIDDGQDIQKDVSINPSISSRRNLILPMGAGILGGLLGLLCMAIAGLALFIGGYTIPRIAIFPDMTPRPNELPVLENTPLPQTIAILPDNSLKVQQISRWGDGHLILLTYSSDKRYIALLTSLGVRIFNSKTLKQIDFIDTGDFNRSFSTIYFNNLDQIIGVVVNENSIQLWDIPHHSLFYTLDLGQSTWIQDVAFSPDGSTILYTDGSKIMIWRVSDGTLIQAIENNDGISNVTFSPDGSNLATSSLIDITFSPDGSILTTSSYINIRRVSDGSIIRTLEGGSDEFSFSRDGSIIASSLEDGTIKLWRVSDGFLLRTIAPQSLCGPTALAFSPEGTELASGCEDHTINLWRVSDGLLINSLIGIKGVVYDLLFSEDNHYLFSISDYSEFTQWDTKNGDIQKSYKYENYVCSVVVSNDGKTAASCPDDSTIKLWNLADGSTLRTIEDRSKFLSSIAFSPDGSMLASGSAIGSIKLWNVSDGSLLRTIDGLDSILQIAFSPDGYTLASIDMHFIESTIKLWRVSDGSILHTFDEHPNYFSDPAFSPDGSTIASADSDDGIKLWHVSDGSLIYNLEGSGFVSFSSDGSMLASGSRENQIKLWSVADGSLLRILEGHQDTVLSAAFSTDGSILSSGSSDNTIKLWRVSDGLLLRTLEGHSDGVGSVAFINNGKFLLSDSWDGTIRLWGVVVGNQ